MNKKNKLKSLIAALILFTLVPFTVIPSLATPPLPPTYIDGADGIGAQMSKESGIIIENQSITFDLTNYPVPNDSNENYSGTVKTEYTLYNPTNDPIILRVAYPITNTPWYVYGKNEDIDITKYRVMVNGENKDFPLRHGLNYNYKNPYTNFGSIISDEYINTEICNPDTVVTKYIFKQSGVSTEGAYVGFDIRDGELDGSSLYLGENARGYNQMDGDIRVNTRAGENGCTYELYVFGKDLMHLPMWKIYKDSGVSDDEEINGKIEFVSKSTLPLSEFVFNYYDESFEISKVDWFNMAAYEIYSPIERGVVHNPLVGLNGGFKDYRISGYIYEIAIEPGARATNTIIAPIYPSIETKYEPFTYTYSYLLPCVSTDLLADNINICINTDYYLIDNQGYNFEKNENGYNLTIDTTKDLQNKSEETSDRLAFILCQTENPTEVEEESSVVFSILMIILTIIAIPILLIVSGIRFLIQKAKEIKGDRQ